MSEFNTDINFWEQWPELKVAGPFKKIYTSDKTRGKSSSSKLSWCIVLIWDKKSKSSNKAKVTELKEWYLKCNETLAMRTLRGILEKLEERDKFLRNTPYDDPVSEFNENYGVSDWAKRIDTIDKMLANTDKIYTLYDKARTVVEKEEQSSTKGDATLSLSDSDEI